MDSKNQFFYFCLSIAIGFTAGLPYEIFALLRQIFRCDTSKNKPISVILDVIYPLIFALICIFAQFIFRFPAFRAYIWIGYALGFIIYLKILRRTLAFLQKTCYNKLAKVLRKAKKREKTLFFTICLLRRIFDKILLRNL